MSRLKVMKDIDFAALGMLGLFFVCFRDEVVSPQDGLMICILIALTAGLWKALSSDYRVSAYIRFGLAVLVFGFSVFLEALQDSRLLLAIFLACLVFFSSSNTNWGRCLRCLCGLTSACVLFTTFSPIFGLPAAILAILVFIGGLLSVWSKMTLNESIWWFAKRSFRKETLFLLMFLAGVGAIGVRQAQNYSSRQVGVSGMSDMVSPGGVRSLIQSKELAIRVRFKEHPTINPNEVYIRGAVMDRSLGFEWMTTTAKILPPANDDSDDFFYNVTLSPRHNLFTPVIDYGVKIVDEGSGQPMVYYPRNNAVFPSGVFHTGWRHYSAASRQVPFHVLTESDDFEGLLRVDGQVNASVRELASNLKQQAQSVDNFVANLTSFYLQNNFSYKLDLKKPVNKLEDFLFDGREGFCEHFASASATLARLAGVPARVVTGFLGGAWDPLTKTLYVRDLDAHAWNEFWDAKKSRWIRFDAVNFLAPIRFEQGSSEYLKSLGLISEADDLFVEKILFSDLMIEFNDIISGFNSGLSIKASQSVIEYGEEMALLGALGLLISYIFLVQRRHKKKSLHPERLLVRQLEQLFAKHSLSRKPYEPVYGWLTRCALEFKADEELIMEFAKFHSFYCHGRSQSAADLEVMKKILKKISSRMKANGS